MDNIRVVQPPNPVVIQSLASVLRNQVNKLLVLTALGQHEPDGTATKLSQPLDDQLLLLQGVLEQDTGWNGRSRLVELLDELAHHQTGRFVMGPVHEEVIPPNKLVVTDEEHLNPCFLATLGEGDDIHVADGIGVYFDLLLFGDLLDATHPVSQHRSTLELQILRRLLHVGLQVGGDGFGIAFHEQGDLVNHLGVIFLAGHSGTGCDTPVDEVFQAGARVFARYGLGARSVREKPLYQVHGLANGTRAGEGTEIPGAIFGDLTSDVDLGEILGQVYLQVRVSFIVFEPCVVARLVALYQGVFQNQRFRFGVGDDALKVVQLAQHPSNLIGQVGRRAEIVAEAVA